MRLSIVGAQSVHSVLHSLSNDISIRPHNLSKSKEIALKQSIYRSKSITMGVFAPVEVVQGTFAWRNETHGPSMCRSVLSLLICIT